MDDGTRKLQAKIDKLLQWQTNPIKKFLPEIPKGRSRRSLMSAEDYLAACNVKALDLGLVLHGISGEYRGSITKLKIECRDHGIQESTCINDFLKKDRKGCRACRDENIGRGGKKSVEAMSGKFMASGGFAQGTTFERSDKITSYRSKPYWWVTCGKCGDKYESESSNLKRGSIACQCSIFRQKECYINSVSDFGTVIALKFGIAKNSDARLKQQQKSCVFQVDKMVVYKFENYNDCLNAERAVRESLECGVISKSDMPDGYTETTNIRNYEKICEIYAEMGGLRA